MGNGSTTADARGNAVAILNVIQSSPPDVCPFSTTLSDGSVALHFVHNVDIMEHAEEIAEIETRASTNRDVFNIYQPPWGDDVSAGERIRRYTTMQTTEGDGHDSGRAARIVADSRRIRQLEELILAEIDEAQSEYHDLARVLCEEREGYAEAVLRSGTGDISEGTRRRMARTGRDNSRPDLSVGDYQTRVSFRRYHSKYVALESGLAIMTTDEQWARFLSTVAREVGMEVATLGLAKYVRAVRVAAGALDNALAGAARAGARALASRYNALPDSTKRRLQSLYERKRPHREPDAPNDGTTNQGTTPTRAGRTCASGACAIR